MNRWVNLAEQRETLKTWLSFLIDTIKLSTLFSGPLGLFLLVAYLSSTGSPMLTPDSSTALTLLLVVASYIFMVFFLCAFVYAPVYTCRVNRKTRLLIKTEDTTATSNIGKFLSQRNGILGRKISNNDFIVFHGPSLSLFVNLALGRLLEFSITPWLVSLSLFTTIGTLASFLRYKHYKILPKYRSVYLSRKFQRLATFRIIQDRLSRGFMALVWILGVFQVVDSIRSQTTQFSHTKSPYFSLLLLASMLFLYFFLTHVRVVITRVPFAFLFLAFVFVIYAPGYAGGLALRVLGIGGGIPISLTIMTIQPGTQETVARTKTGCLIIKSGSEVIIKTTDNVAPKTCNPSIFANLSMESASRIQMFSQVEVFPTSQVIQINKLDVIKP